MSHDPKVVADAIVSVSRAYLPERIVYMVGAGAGVLMLLFLIYSKLGSTFDGPTIAGMFGGGGMFTATGYGLLRAFDKAMNVVGDVLRASPVGGAGNGEGEP